SKPDLLPLNLMLSANLTQSEVTESILVPLVNQFGLMQQQMFDQFQQAMAMMVQVFGTMHRDQMEVIRAELDQLRELTEEFHALKSELARRTQNETRETSRESAFNEAGLDQPNGVAPDGLASPVVISSDPKGNLRASRINNAPASLFSSPSSKITGQRSL